MRFFIAIVFFPAGLLVGAGVYAAVIWLGLVGAHNALYIAVALVAAFVTNMLEARFLWGTRLPDVDDLSLCPVSIGWFTGFSLLMMVANH
ncbi:hypothetical protein HUS23_08545 [Ectothiorhodospiraceae bacterium 2226]|nr:hypothetical protein HUS23_08545 [Ectothiorhodospiraceae bacterium 2226]